MAKKTKRPALEKMPNPQPLPGVSPFVLVLNERIALWLTGCALVLRLFLPGLAVEMGENGLIWIFAGGAFLFTGLDILFQPGATLPRPALALPLLSAIGMAFLSTLWSANYVQTLYQSGIWLADLLVFFTLGYWGVRSSWRPIISATLLAGVTMEASYALYQYFVGLPATRAYVAQNSGLLYQLDLSSAALPLFLQKLQNDQIFGHFTLSNSLGIYLAMFLPVLIGLAHRSWSKSPWTTLLLGSIAMTLAVGLYLTKSRGSLLSLLLVVGGFGLYRLCRRLRPALTLWIGLGCLLGSLVVAYLLAYTPLGYPLGHAGHSFVMRIGYWLAAWQIIRHHTLLGTGVGTFSDYYYTYKEIWVEEVNKAHNGYLQWWTETGVLGLIVMIWALLVVAKVLLTAANTPTAATTAPDQGSRSGNDPSKTGRPIAGAWLMPSATLVVFALLMLQGRWIETEALLAWWSPTWSGAESLMTAAAYLSVPLAALVWWALFRFFYRLAVLDTGTAGWRLGLAMLAIHSLLDIDWYEPTLSQTGCLFLALVVTALPGQMQRFVIAYPPKAIALMILAVPSAWMTLSLIPDLLTAAHLKRAVPDIQYQWSKSTTPAQAAELERSFWQILQTANRLTPWDHNLADAISSFLLDKARQAARQPRQVKNEQERLAQLLEMSAAAATQTIRYRPHFAPGYFSRAQIFVETAKIWGELGDPQRQAVALARARQELQKALEIYPNKAIFLALAGNIARQAGDLATARQHYRRALYYNDLSKGWISMTGEPYLESLEQVSAFFQERK